MTRRLLPALLAAAIALGAAGCGGDPAPAADAPHTHTALAAGDGTRASYVGYTLADVRFPARPGVPGTLSFQIQDDRKQPVTDFLVELTKEMHVYVVSTDLSVFRHVHPEKAADGTWTGNLTVPRPGRYRVVVEFTARDEGGNGDQVVLGVERTLGTPGKDVPAPPATTETTVDGTTVTITKPPTVGYEHQMELGISRDGEPAALGTYLGVYAHVSAFNLATGALVHMHPLGSPETRDGRSDLTFHTGFRVPGDYRMFVQTRLSGVVRTIPMTITVTGEQPPAP
ncbi:hypothetical protein EFK50_18110 [Nocardioides marmoriginsengisoli]|uniref:Heavy-metal-associated domain-containing protein n=1 Tax=Nocardioides marmoriginsengisoli TaxID=661483 RepID=A0A3N0CCY2_9ACTN|nr:hypothetical protein [Nocardioides marmoriginsengisoli]RNL61278.1 hypothetical protein EFK50_18110 [Nocardioides marmoriginsengisoli]